MRHEAEQSSMAAVNDPALLRPAGRQHGLLTTRQLARLGFSKDGIFRRVKAGVLFRVYHGGRPFEDRCHPVTAPAWTLLDLAADGMEPVRVGGALDDVLVRKLASLGAVERVVARVAPLRLPGAGLLADLVDERRRGKKPSETGLEDELLDVFRAYGLPEPVRQFVLPLPGGGTARFDAAYPELRLEFEADGNAWHKGLLDRMRDEARDERCGLAGWTVRRYGTEDIRDRPAGIGDEVLRLRSAAEAA